MIHPGVETNRSLVAPSRVTMGLAEYLERGAQGQHVCFEHGHVAEPRCRSTSEMASNCRERTCGVCGNSSAVPLDQAVRELWLTVTDVAGRPLNDVPQVSSLTAI